MYSCFKTSKRFTRLCDASRSRCCYFHHQRSHHFELRNQFGRFCIQHLNSWEDKPCFVPRDRKSLRQIRDRAWEHRPSCFWIFLIVASVYVVVVHLGWIWNLDSILCCRRKPFPDVVKVGNTERELLADSLLHRSKKVVLDHRPIHHSSLLLNAVERFVHVKKMMRNMFRWDHNSLLPTLPLPWTKEQM